MKLDPIDRRMIAHLRLDGRASVTTLAGVLGLARGTVQSRLTQLIDRKIIKRFTVELNTDEGLDVVHAVMMIKVSGNTAANVQKALIRMPEVTSLHRTCGIWDVVIQLETASLAEFDFVLNRIRELHGVSNSETCPLLRKIS